MNAAKRTALVAHDERKVDLLAWARYHVPVPDKHRLFVTGNTGELPRDSCRKAADERSYTDGKMQ